MEDQNMDLKPKSPLTVFSDLALNNTYALRIVFLICIPELVLVLSLQYSYENSNFHVQELRKVLSDSKH